MKFRLNFTLENALRHAAVQLADNEEFVQWMRDHNGLKDDDDVVDAAEEALENTFYNHVSGDDYVTIEFDVEEQTAVVVSDPWEDR